MGERTRHPPSTTSLLGWPTEGAASGYPGRWLSRDMDTLRTGGPPATVTLMRLPESSSRLCVWTRDLWTLGCTVLYFIYYLYFGLEYHLTTVLTIGIIEI